MYSDLVAKRTLITCYAVMFTRAGSLILPELLAVTVTIACTYQAVVANTCSVAILLYPVIYTLFSLCVDPRGNMIKLSFAL